jgi:hypothetical protein
VINRVAIARGCNNDPASAAGHRADPPGSASPTDGSFHSDRVELRPRPDHLHRWAPSGRSFGYARGVAYRGDAGDVCEAPTAEGTLRVELAPRHVRLSVANRSIDISDAFVTVVEHHRKHAAKDKRTSIRIAGRVIVARGVPREDVGVWVEVESPGPRAGIRRIFGVEPVRLLEPEGLTALGALDRLFQRLRHELAHLAPDLRRAFELGSPASGGLDKVLVIDQGDHWSVYARRLFRDRARLVMTIHEDGRILVREGRGAGTARGATDSGPQRGPEKPRSGEAERAAGKDEHPAGEAQHPSGKEKDSSIKDAHPASQAKHLAGEDAPQAGEDAQRSAAESLPAGIRAFTVRSRHGVTVVGDYLRFADPQGTDLARVSIPWIGPEDRLELAHRIGQLIDHEHRDAPAWPPRLAADADPAS